MTENTKFEKQQVQIENLTTRMNEVQAEQQYLRSYITMLEESVISLAESQEGTEQYK